MHRFSLSDNWFPHSFFSIQVGENGAGKTTLLKLLMGTLDPIKGIRHAHRNLKIGYFTQHHVDQLDMSQSSVELLAARFPGKLYRQGRIQVSHLDREGNQVSHLDWEGNGPP